MRKSVLIIGSAVAVLGVLAVAVPPLIDWTGTKTRIADRIAAATDRPVRIDGKMTLRLLPSPALSAEGVVIGNPGGMAGDLVRVEHLRLKPALLPLLTGTVRLRTLELDRPVVTLARDAQGRPNWRFAAPARETAAGSETPPDQPHRRAAAPEEAPPAEADEPLPVEFLAIRDGTIRYGDSPSLTALDADIALGGRSGPFQGQGRARLGGVTVAVEGAMDRIAPGRGSPATLALHLPGEDARLEVSGLISRLSGGETLRGRLTVKAGDPGATLARLGVEAALPPGALNLGGDLTLSAEEAALTALELSLGDARATGSLSAGLGDVPQMEVRLDAPALDLDRWTRGDGKAAASRADAPPAATASRPEAGGADRAEAGPAGFDLPRALFVSATLGVDRLTWRGQDVRQARLEAVLDGGEVMVRQAHAKLPGATDAAVDGTLSAVNGHPVFDGTVRVKSEQPPALLAWLGTGLGAAPNRLELTAPVRLAWPDMAVDDFRLTLDGVPARGTVLARLGRQPALTVTAAVTGMEVMVKGRMAEGKRVEDGAFKITSNQGLRPLRAFGVKPPAALDRLGPFTAEGTAAGSLDSMAVDARAESGGVTLTTRGTLAGLNATPRGDMAVHARAASLAQVLRLFGDSRAAGGGAFALEARVAGDTKAVDVTGLTLRAGPSSLGGQGHVDLTGARPAIRADLTADTLALDMLAAPERSGRLLPGGPLVPPTAAPGPLPVVPAGLVGAGAAPFSREPLDLSALNTVDAQLAVRAQTVTAKGWRLDNAVMQAAVAGGTASVQRLTGTLLGGEVSATAKLSAGATPSLSGQITVNGADLAPVRLAAAGMAVTQGRLDADARFATSGRSSHDMAARLTGDGKMLVRDGVVDGFDLPAVNRQMGNLRNIGSVLGVVQAGLSGGRTPFSRLAGTFRADGGTVVSRDLTLTAEGGGANADTVVNLPDWSTRTAIAFHLAAAPQTPVGIRLEGPLENPRKIIDLNAIQQFMVAQGLGRALKLDNAQPEQPGDQPREKNTGKNILKNLLKGLGGQ